MKIYDKTTMFARFRILKYLLNFRYYRQGQFRSKWQLSARSYRSTLGAVNGSTHERSMCLLTMNDNVFVLLEDPSAPTRADLAYHASQTETAIVELTHYRNTFLTLSPPGALEQLLSLLRARWMSTKQSAGNTTQHKQTAAQLAVEGNIYAIGTDWIIRAGNVILATGAVKGMLLEVIKWDMRIAHGMCSRSPTGRVSTSTDDEFPRVQWVIAASFEPFAFGASQRAGSQDGGSDD